MAYFQRKDLVLAAVAAASLAASGLVMAQGAPGAPAKPAAAPGTPAAPAPAPGPAAPEPEHVPPAPGNVDLPIRARANIPIPAMTQQTTDYIAKMNDTLKRLVQLQEIARRQKDVIKLNCVNDKLLQHKQLLNIADQAQTNMQEAIARGDEDARYHEFGRVTIAYQQSQALSTDAENCIGEDLTFLGPTTVTVEEPAIPEDNTAPQGPDYPVVQPLPVASPIA
jgi:hypothetical protein